MCFYFAINSVQSLLSSLSKEKNETLITNLENPEHKHGRSTKKKNRYRMLSQMDPQVVRIWTSSHRTSPVETKTRRRKLKKQWEAECISSLTKKHGETLKTSSKLVYSKRYNFKVAWYRFAIYYSGRAYWVCNKWLKAVQGENTSRIRTVIYIIYHRQKQRASRQQRQLKRRRYIVPSGFRNKNKCITYS